MTDISYGAKYVRQAYGILGYINQKALSRGLQGFSLLLGMHLDTPEAIILSGSLVFGGEIFYQRADTRDKKIRMGILEREALERQEEITGLIKAVYAEVHPTPTEDTDTQPTTEQ